MTPRYELPLLVAGQAQKEISHNEALVLIDSLIQASAETMGEAVPQLDPALGQCWIVGAEPVGAWTGAASKLALWTGGGWRFVAPREGMRVHIRNEGVDAIFVDGAWRLGVIHANELIVAGQRVLGEQQPGIEAPDGGSLIDGEARLVITQILAALREHGLVAS